MNSVSWRERQQLGNPVGVAAVADSHVRAFVFSGHCLIGGAQKSSDAAIDPAGAVVLAAVVLEAVLLLEGVVTGGAGGGGVDGNVGADGG